MLTAASPAATAPAPLEIQADPPPVSPTWAAAAHGTPGSTIGTGVWVSKGAGAAAAALASVNIFGGFLVTQRMLAMYRKKDRTPGGKA